MMANKYLVTARCENKNCRTEEFQLLRRKMTYMSSTNQERVINRVVCPHCRMLGHVEKITTITAEQAVA